MPNNQLADKLRAHADRIEGEDSHGLVADLRAAADLLGGAMNTSSSGGSGQTNPPPPPPPSGGSGQTNPPGSGGTNG